MKALGVFRGFPGLGRVVGGVEILISLRDLYGCEITVFSYMQGARYADSCGITVVCDVPESDICPIGVLPTGCSCSMLSGWIEANAPDVVIIDGEPLILHALRIRFPRLKIVALLNPADVSNPDNYPISMDYFRALYGHADISIIHGLRLVKDAEMIRGAYTMPTIVRKSVANIRRNPAAKIYCVLGGGTVNASAGFLDSTTNLAKLVVGACERFPAYQFEILCGCGEIFSQVSPLVGNVPNLNVCMEIKDPTEFYTDASLVIARAGRNTLSELRLLGIPTLAIVTGCRFRVKEQQQNVESLGSSVAFANAEIPLDQFGEMIEGLLLRNEVREVNPVENGREKALEVIASQLGIDNAHSQI